MSNQDRIRASFQDSVNKVAVSLVYVNHNTATAIIDDYRDALTLICETVVIETRQDSSVYGPAAVPGASGPYSGCRDMVTLEFRAADGSIWPITAAGPKVGIFLPDGETVDVADLAVQELITWAIAVATTKTGSPLLEYQRGWRWHLDE